RCARHRDRRAPRLRGRVRGGCGLRGRGWRAGRPAAALPAAHRPPALGDVLQHRHHRRDGQRARRVRGRAYRLGRGVAGRRVPQPVDEGAGELRAPRRDPSRQAGGHLRQARDLKYLAALAVVVLLALPLVLSSYLGTVFVLIFFCAYLGQAWSIVGAYAGPLSAGHAAFVGVGDCTAAVGLYITSTGNPRQSQFQDTRAYYYIALGLMIAATAVAAAIDRRRFGVYLSAIREDEGAAEAVGVPTFRYKMLAMIVSSFL